MDIIAIDTHNHINHGSIYDTKTSEVYTADFDKLSSLADGAKIGRMLCSSFSSVLNTAEIEKENEFMYELAQKEDRLYQWVVIDPKNDNTFIQAEKMLGSKKCVGIKLHPIYHQYSLLEYGEKIFSFAQERKAIVQIHPECDADYILPFANRFTNVKFIMSHLGDVSYVKAISEAKNKNVWTDTSGSASVKNLVIEYAVECVGSERILFGTDSYSPAFQRGRIEYALISDRDKENILKNNAEKLFGEIFE